jgi:squalene-hopene/tetraprenyl-beta-curcumene cyclase
LLGLVAAGRAQRPSAGRPAAYLRATQRTDGAWDETAYTGTGFPRVFYLKYHLYRIYFPLMALARYQAATAQAPLPLPVATVSGAQASRIPASPTPFNV